MTRLLSFCLGLVLFLVGLASLPFPIPGGLFATALGMVLLIYSSPGVEAGVRAARARYRWFHRSISWLEVRVGQRVGAVLQTTRPPRGPRDGGA
jgi:hypothetical protein